VSDAITCMNRLDAFAVELDTLSKALAETERRLEPLECGYEEFLGEYEIWLVEQAQEKGEKPPAERLRERMALKAMPREILGPYLALSAKRRRMEKRISAIKAGIEAQRSLLSAYKLEVEGGGSGLRAQARAA
jgi:hypothetical protein